MPRPQVLLVLLAALGACAPDEAPAPAPASPEPPPVVAPAEEPEAKPEPQFGDPQFGGRTVVEWADALGESESPERSAALDALAALQDSDRDALFALFLAGLAPDEITESGDAARDIVVAIPSRFLDLFLGATANPQARIRARLFEALQDTVPDADGRERLLAVAVGGLADSDEDVRQWAFDALEQALAYSPAPPADATLAALFVLLKSPRRETRSFAVDACVLVGSAAAPATADLVALLADEYARDGAMEALGRIGRRAVPALVAVLGGDSDRESKAGALDALAEIGMRAAPAAATVAGIARGDDPELAAHAVRALGAFGAAVPEALPIFVAQLSSEERWGPREALDAIRELGHAGVSIDAAAPALVRILGEGDGKSVFERALAADALALAPAAPGTLAALLSALDDVSPEVRAHAALAFRSWPPSKDGTAPAEIVEGLARRRGDEDVSVRLAVVLALDYLPLPPEGVDALLDILGDTDFAVRRTALRALGRPGRVTRATDPIRPALFRLLGDGDGDIRGGAALLLVRTAGPMQTLLAEVARGLNDNDVEVVADTLTALGDAGPAAAEFRLDVEAFLSHQWSEVRCAAIEALAGIDPYGATTAATLAVSLADPVHRVRVVAARALGRLPYSAPSTDELLDQLLDTWPPLRAAVIEGVAGFGDRALGQVLEALDHDDPDVRLGAVAILRTIDADLAVVAESAAARLEDEDARVRAEAVRVLAARPEAGADHMGSVEDLLEDQDAVVRVAAAGALVAFDRGDERVTRVLTDGIGVGFTRLASARALAALGPAAAPAEPALRGALGQADAAERRLAVVRALAGLGPAARPSIGVLTAVLLGEAPGLPHDEDDETSIPIRLAAVDALVAIGGSDARSSIEHGLLDPSTEVRVAARDALERAR